MASEAIAYKARRMHPPTGEVFNAFKSTPLDEVKVIIIGQDPYHSPNTDHGLAFSTLAEKTPKSLKNIFKEIWQQSDKTVKFEECFPSNNLTHWANQGVLLLNTVLTVEDGMPLSRAHLGWEQFVAHVVRQVLEKRKTVVIMGWGKYAQNFIKQAYSEYLTGTIVSGGYRLEKEPDMHKLFLFADHPAAAAYSRDRWFGNNHFAMCNMFLMSRGLPEIDWTTKPMTNDTN